MKAVSGNKEYTIDESQQKFYQDSGFDIKDDSGRVIVYGRGKTVPYGDYVKLKEEFEKLLAEQKEDPAVIEILSVYAEEHQIDLGRATTASGIAKKIKEAKPGGSE